MKRVRLYLDEDSVSHSLVAALKSRGVDVTSVLDQGMLGRDDDEQLDFATEQGRVVYSFNIADFFRIHTRYMRAGKHHAGLILAQQQRYSIGEQMRRLLRIVATLTAEEMHNRIEFLSAWK